MTTAQQSSQQSPAVFDRSTRCVTSRIVVMCDHRLIALIHIPVNVALVMIRNQYRPVFAAVLHLPKNPLLSGLKPGNRLAAPIRVRARVERILQYAEHRMVPSGLPDNLSRLFWPTSDRQLHLLLVQPEIDL